MEEFSKSIDKEGLEDLYNTYMQLVSLIEELNNSIKELPPKEELQL